MLFFVESRQTIIFADIYSQMIDFNSLAAVNGKPGLYIIIKPTRTGVVLEAMEEPKLRVAINSNNKVSILRDITIYTTDAEANVPLEKVMKNIYNIFKTDIKVTSKSSDADLRAFIKKALPNYDESRVYVSDIKKLVTWYSIIIKTEPEIFVEKVESKPENEEKPAKTEDPKEEKPKTKAASKPKNETEEQPKAKAEPKAKKAKA